MDWLDLFAVQGIIVCSLDQKKKKKMAVLGDAVAEVMGILNLADLGEQW